MSVEGFWLTLWFAKRSFLQNLMFWRRAQKLMLTDLRSGIRKKYPLQEAQTAVQDYQNQMTAGKILFIPEL